MAGVVERSECKCTVCFSERRSSFDIPTKTVQFQDLLHWQIQRGDQIKLNHFASAHHRSGDQAYPDTGVGGQVRVGGAGCVSCYGDVLSFCSA